MFIRTITGILIIVVLTAAILVSEYTAAALFLFCIILGLQEFYTIAKRNGISTQRYLGTLLGVMTFLLSSAIMLGHIPLHYSFVIVPFIFLIFIAELFRKKKNPFTSIAFTLLAVIYIALPFSFLFGLGFFNEYQFSEEYSPDLLMGSLILMWSNDTGAYLVGRQFGKNKLFERISPKKTWEGSLGGATLTIITSIILHKFHTNIDLLDWLFVALFIVFFGSIGDLIESMFKRSANVKDSSDLLPGHGGILDRFDSLLLAAPFVYSYLQIVSNI